MLHCHHMDTATGMLNNHHNPLGFFNSIHTAGVIHKYSTSNADTSFSFLPNWQYFSFRCNYFSKIRIFRKKQQKKNPNIINSYRWTAREKKKFIYLALFTSLPGPPIRCAQCLVKITWNKGIEVRLQGPELVNVVISLLLRYPPRVIWVLGAAVLLLPLHWKRLKGGTLAPGTGRAPGGHWEPQETRLTLLYVAETNFQKTGSRNGHTDDHPSTYLLKLRLLLGIFAPAIKEALHDQCSKEKEIWLLLTTRSPSHILLFWIHFGGPLFLPCITTLNCTLYNSNGFVQENLSLLWNYIFNLGMVQNYGDTPLLDSLLTPVTQHSLC